MPAPPFTDIHVGGLTLHLYGLILGLAMIIAVQILDRTMGWMNLDRSKTMTIALPAIVAGLVGARLYHVISKPSYYMDHPMEILEVWHGGLGIYGGVLLGTLVGLWRARSVGVPLRPVLDAAAPAIIIAQAIGRWGNYVNQELFGKPTSLPWGLKVEAPYRPERFLDNTTFHPTFLYESLWCLFVGILLLYLIKHWINRPPGILFAIYAVAYSVERLFVEHLRVDPAHVYAGLRQNEWLAIGVAVIAAGFVASMMVRNREPA